MSLYIFIQKKFIVFYTKNPRPSLSYAILRENMAIKNDKKR